MDAFSKASKTKSEYFFTFENKIYKENFRRVEKAMKILKASLKKIGVINVLIVLLLAIAWVLIGINDTMDVINAISGNPIYKGSADKREVALTINVVWGDEYIEPMLDILAKENVKATFFIGGKWAEDSTELLMKIVNAGHEIGNHGYSHEHMSKLSYEKNVEQIKKSADAIFNKCGIAPILFAPPYGEFNDTTLKAASDLGCTTIMWSVDTIDWRGDGVNAIIGRIKKNCHDGAIILAHPTADTIKALPEIISFVKESGRSFTTVGELLK